ncbi:hypothetical protein EW146_g7920 [Bondarzewia mesenterica]|uniref:Uncharacterized protein n=1 Tax=Bondarzewia mesenterica TaxID=1095465 RepID=A0A4S4LJ35_9AGAM|nr:hypothetical protein EW146_g7920 [Bondarzewia mesenterica]
MSSAIADIAKKRRGLVARRVLLNLRAREPAMGASAEEVASWGGSVVRRLLAFEAIVGPEAEDDEVEDFTVLASARLEEFGDEAWLEWGIRLMPLTAYERERRLAKEVEVRVQAAAGSRVVSASVVHTSGQYLTRKVTWVKERRVAKVSGGVGIESGGSTSHARAVNDVKATVKVTATAMAEVTKDQQAISDVRARLLTLRSAKGKLDKVTASTSTLKEVNQDEALPAGAFKPRVVCRRCASFKSIERICWIAKAGVRCLKCERDHQKCSLVAAAKRRRPVDDTSKAESQTPAKKRVRFTCESESDAEFLEADTDSDVSGTSRVLNMHLRRKYALNKTMFADVAKLETKQKRLGITKAEADVDELEYLEL